MGASGMPPPPPSSYPHAMPPQQQPRPPPQPTHSRPGSAVGIGLGGLLSPPPFQQGPMGGMGYPPPPPGGNGGYPPMGPGQQPHGPSSYGE